MLYFLKGGAATAHGCYCHQSGAGSATKKKKKEKKRSTYKIPQVVYTIVMGYIFNGTYSAKGSFVKELNIYLKKESFLFTKLFAFGYLCLFVKFHIFKSFSPLKIKILLKSFLTEGGVDLQQRVDEGGRGS